MNVIRECYDELFGQHGLALFDLPPVVYASPSWRQALQHCHQVQLRSPRARTGVAKVRGRRPIHIPGGTMKVIATTCSPHFCDALLLFLNQLTAPYQMAFLYHLPLFM